MTRKEEIHEIANTINPNVGKEWIDEDYNCSDVYDFTIGFECGAKWADENPNLYSDEKYQTIKVSDLDELHRKAELYDKVVDKVCEWVRNRDNVEKYLHYRTSLVDNFADAFRRKLEE